MRLKKINVQNFRLLKNVSLSIEDQTTVIVGRNNSGKTSLSELFRRIFSDSQIQFQLEDFNLSSHKNFIDAYGKHSMKEDDIQSILPEISITLWVEYDKESPDLSYLSEFIIDLDMDANIAIINLTYKIQNDKIENLFFSTKKIETTDNNAILQLVKQNLTRCYELTVLAIDPTDKKNFRKVDVQFLRSLICGNFINAQRGLDDVTHKEKHVLGRILEKIFSFSNLENAKEKEKQLAAGLSDAVAEIQKTLDGDFNKNLNGLLPALKSFGYPGFSDPQFKTETILDTQKLLTNHTKLKYLSEDSIGLPETHNGLGSRNLIYIIFHLFDFFKSYQSKTPNAGVHLIFVEEPEAHLHPQMQEVFIKQIGTIISKFSEELAGEQTWPVQFIITTHSTHMANSANFDSIRYFLSKRDGSHHTITKDLRSGFNNDVIKKEIETIEDPEEKKTRSEVLNKQIEEDKVFLHKYLTLTRCDLFFADQAILVEGASERIMLPELIRKNDVLNPSSTLKDKYITTIEVGGAYAHRFFRLLQYLEIPTLIVTDIDSIDSEKKKCAVIDSVDTSNNVLKYWFSSKNIAPSELITKSNDDKINGFLRLAYQIPEDGLQICGRSFEDSFILANREMFDVPTTTDEEISDYVWNKAKNIDKTNFALKYGVELSDWEIPKYIAEGLVWLASYERQ